MPTGFARSSTAYRSTLDDDAADEYEVAFVKAATRRFRKLAVGLGA